MGPILSYEDALPYVINQREDRDQPALQRFEPSSCTPLIGEQPNPWYLLQHRDGISRHRGAKRPCR